MLSWSTVKFSETTETTQLLFRPGIFHGFSRIWISHSNKYPYFGKFTFQCSSKIAVLPVFRPLQVSKYTAKITEEPHGTINSSRPFELNTTTAMLRQWVQINQSHLKCSSKLLATVVCALRTIVTTCRKNNHRHHRHLWEQLASKLSWWWNFEATIILMTSSVYLKKAPCLEYSWNCGIRANCLQGKSNFVL